MVIQERSYTAEAFWEIYGGKKFVELVNGEPRETMPAGGEHGGITNQLGRHIGSFVEEHNLGYVTAAETGYILYKDPTPQGKDTVRGPDVGFITLHRLPEGLPEKYIPFGPDLAVEVISPGNSADDIQEKIDDYFLPDTGTRLVWVVYPRSKTVNIHTREGSKRVGIDGILDGGDVLPGFRLEVARVFPKPK